MDIQNKNDYNFPLSNDKMTEPSKNWFLNLYLLYTLNKNLSHSLRLDDLFNNTVDFLKDALKIDGFHFLLMDEDGEELKVWKANDSAVKSSNEITLKKGEGISGVVAQTGETILIRDICELEGSLRREEKVTNAGSFLSVPLKLTDTRIIGVLNFYKKETNAFREEDKTFFNSLAQNIAVAIERTKLYEKAQKQSIFDDVTTLYTKKYFIESCDRELSKAKRDVKHFSIIMASIENFKYLNETHGRLFGDAILKKLAYVLKSSVRDGDIVCRYGGEEFAILLPGVGKDSAQVITEKIRKKVKDALLIAVSSDKFERVNITIGSSAYPHDGITVKKILNFAFHALSLDKKYLG
ncbi:MAG: sensor domain-containing diguanylate cyclase [Candidatus Brocadiaceae bacterium]|nr:sensor domain-containing diguanylate cyclase [Candidatus Brocadiaceae bacterium]